MGISQIITLVVAILLIGFILWWFFGKHTEAVGTANVGQGSQEADIVVKGGYSPSTIVLKQGVPALPVYLMSSLNNLALTKI